jgi:hypothetical protein
MRTRVILPGCRHIGKMRGEGEENRTGFNADILVSPAGDRNARPDTVGHEQGTKTVGRHRDRRMGFILDANLAHLRAEADADWSERRETNGQCPLQRPGDQADERVAVELDLAPVDDANRLAPDAGLA